VEALRGINLRFGSGESIAIAGASGAGKTTLLHILGTIDRPSEGRIFYDGEDVFALKERDRARFRNRTVGFVFQFHHLLPEFTALENTMMPALIQGMPREKAKGRAEELIEHMGLLDRMTHKPGELSGGEQQRIAVARALIMEPKVLLADEPTGNLDRETGEGIFRLILEMHKQKDITTVVVTHNEEIAECLPRHIRLVDGKVLT
jgi:lipoprotein-releasing system ATP-binding protein